MGWFAKTLTSSIGKKFLMGLTGLGLCGFLAVHLYGNLMIFAGREAFNGYAEHLESNPYLIVMELGLAALFIIHIISAVLVTVDNTVARPVKYAVYEKKGGSTFASRTMVYSAIIVFVFLTVHLINFRFASQEVRGDLYTAAVSLFRNPGYVLWYVFAVCVLGLHVSHGLQSGFRSVGFNHPKYTPTIEWISRLFGIVMAVGFAAIPIWVCFFKGGQP